MKYVINIVIFLILLFIVISTKRLEINNKKISNKLKTEVINTIRVISVILLSTIILFIIFQIILYSLNINEFFLDTIFVSIYAAFIVYLGDYISKPILRKISLNNFSKEYGGKSLTEKEMKEIYNRYRKSFLYWNYIFKFLINGIVYSLITDFILSETNLLIIILISLTSVIFYGTLFKRITR